MSVRSLVEINHDYYPDDAAAFGEAIRDYISSGDPDCLPRGIIAKWRSHHSDLSPLEEAREHREVAAILAMDIDILHEIVADGAERLTKEQLISQIRLLKRQRDEAINNPEVRRSRYGAASLLFHMASSGMLRNIKIDEA